MQHPLAKLIIGGRERSQGSAGTLHPLDPATAVPLQELPRASRAEALEAAEAAALGQLDWSALSAFERYTILRRAASAMREDSERGALAITREQGKPLEQARTEWLASADLLDWHAEEGRRLYGREVPSRSPNLHLRVLPRPIGPVAALTAWNFPAWGVMQKMGAALAAGCSVVVKPAETSPTPTWLIARALLDAGVPPRAISVLWGEPEAIAETLIAAPQIRAVTLTGSATAGRQVASAAGKALKKVVMELGGHGPVVITRDADLQRLVAEAARWKFRNAGQVCVSPTRFIVEAPLYEAFVEGFAAAAAQLRVGPGDDPSSQMGPLTTERQLRHIEALVADAAERGARICCGGQRLHRPGFFHAPTVLADVPLEARAMNEEPFGPLALVTRVESLEQALVEANRLPVGLGAYLFSNQPAAIAEATAKLHCGMLAINHFALSMPEMPFGGVRDSGFGSEGGSEGVHAFTSPQAISEYTLDHMAP